MEEDDVMILKIRVEVKILVLWHFLVNVLEIQEIQAYTMPTSDKNLAIFYHPKLGFKPKGPLVILF